MRRSRPAAEGLVPFNKRKSLRRIATAFLLANGSLAALSGCTTVSTSRVAAVAPPKIEPGMRWALLPIVNLTETPQAGMRAESLLESLLRNRGVAQLRRYPTQMNQDTLLEPSERKSVDQALAWAKTDGARYAVTGSVEEWRYKVGVDGEAAVGLSIQIIDVTKGEVIWSISGGKTGWAREALSAVALQLLAELTATLPLSVAKR